MAADPADVPTDVPTTLRVVTCRTAMSPGGIVDAPRVVCPARGEGVPIEECLRCPRIVDFVRDSALAVSVIRCEIPSHSLRRERLGRKMTRFAAQQAHVASLLVRDVLCVGPHLAADEAAEVLVRAGVTEAVVVDSRRHPIGIVEEADLLAAAAEPGPRRTVGELMSAVAITLVETASIATAAALIARDRICAVPVVDSRGRVIGVLTPFDLVGWLAPPPSSGP
jgi:CBS domain-containing protein